MIPRIGNRFALSQIASIAMAETRLAGQAVPNILRSLAPIVAWSVASIALGLVVGLAAVILPPLGAFGIVAAAAVVLLWVMPDLPLVSPGINSQGVLRHADRRYFRSLLLHGSVPRPALDFCPSPRHLRALHAIPYRHCSIVRRPTAHYRASSRLAPYFYLRGRISCHGGAINSHVGAPNGVPLGFNRCCTIVVCAVLSLGLYR